MKTEFTADIPLPPHNPEMEDASKRLPDIGNAQAFQSDRVAVQAEHQPSELADDPLKYATLQCVALQTRIDESRAQVARLSHDLRIANQLHQHANRAFDREREIAGMLHDKLHNERQERRDAERALVVSTRVWMVCSTIGCALSCLVGWAIHG